MGPFIQAGHLAEHFRKLILASLPPRNPNSWEEKELPKPMCPGGCLHAECWVIIEACMCVRAKLLQLCLFWTLWTVTCQAPLSMGFSRQEYWTGLPFPPPGDLPLPGIEPASLMSPALQADSLPLAPPEKPVCIWGSK